MQKLIKTFQYGDHEVTLETGRIARQAGGAVMVSMGDTRVMVTVVGRKEADPGVLIEINTAIMRGLRGSLPPKGTV